jgi:hypothetical protein
MTEVEVEVDALPPPGFEAVAVAGAVATMEEAVQAHQMRFILAWALRLHEVAQPARPEAQREGPKYRLPPM